MRNRAQIDVSGKDRRAFAVGTVAGAGASGPHGGDVGLVQVPVLVADMVGREPGDGAGDPSRWTAITPADTAVATATDPHLTRRLTQRVSAGPPRGGTPVRRWSGSGRRHG